MLSRRWLGSALVATLLASCSLSGPSDPIGVLIVTAGGTALADGDVDVPPTLELQVSASRPLKSGEVQIQLDGTVQTLGISSGSATLTVPALALGSVHHLDVMVATTSRSFDFHVIGLTQAEAALHTEGSTQVVDLVFDHAPERSAVAAAASGATAVWRDDEHVRLTWNTTQVPPALSIAQDLPVQRGSHLAGPLRLDLSPLPAGQMRRAIEPVTALAHPPLLGFSTSTVASRASLSGHAGQLAVASPTGWRLGSDGSLTGVPDAVAVAAAQQAGTPLWPLVQNEASDTAGTGTLLADSQAVAGLASRLATAAAQAGVAGVNLDVEGIPPTSRDGFTQLVRVLSGELHSRQLKLAVDVVPHKPDHLNAYSAAYDVPALAGLADSIVLMAYDQNAAAGSPGPVAGLDWDSQLLDGTLAGVNASHIWMGIPLYARTWQSTSVVADSYTSTLSSALTTPGAVVDYDFGAQTPFIRYQPAGGDVALAYLEDADSLARKEALAVQRGMAGIAAWRLGFEDPAWWASAP